MSTFDILREAGRVTFFAANGVATVELPQPNLARITYEGIGHEGFVPLIVEEILARGQLPVVLAVDASLLSSYETGFRRRWTAWMQANPPRAVLILSGSRLVAMGIALANKVLNGAIEAFTSREEFERAVAVHARPRPEEEFTSRSA